MQKEDEITVKVTCSYEEIVKCLEQKGFNLLENFVMNDIYMIRDDIDISTMKSLDVLKKLYFNKGVCWYRKRIVIQI